MSCNNQLGAIQTVGTCRFILSEAREARANKKVFELDLCDLNRKSSLEAMWCVHCIQLVNGNIDHEPCKEAVWFTMSEEYTRNREAFKRQYDFAPKGATVDPREPLERSVSR